MLGRPLFELAQGALPEGNGGHSGSGGDQLRREVGAAALNALLGARLSGEPAGSVVLGAENGLDLVLRLSQGKSLAMVGRFPYLDRAASPAATRCWS